jgi:hypothetical protein
VDQQFVHIFGIRTVNTTRIHKKLEFFPLFFTSFLVYSFEKSKKFFVSQNRDRYVVIINISKIAGLLPLFGILQ